MVETRSLFTPVQAAIWMMGALFCMVLFMGLASSINPEVVEDQVSLGALSAVSFLVVTSLLLGRYPGGANLREAVGARPPNPLLLLLAASIGLLSQAPAEQLRSWVNRVLPPALRSSGAGLILASHTSIESVALVLVLVGLVPLAEEIFFRGAVYGALRRSRSTPYAAAVVSAAGFTLCHVNLQLLLPIAFVASVFGFLRASSGSLYPSLVAHMAFNAVPVVTSLQGLHVVEIWVHQFGFEIFAALVVAGALFHAVASRSERAAHDRAEDGRPVLPAAGPGDGS